jgi:hypothetical protein
LHFLVPRVHNPFDGMLIPDGGVDISCEQSSPVINAQILKTQTYRLTTFYDNTFCQMRYSINRRNFLLEIIFVWISQQRHNRNNIIRLISWCLFLECCHKMWLIYMFESSISAR